MIRLIKLRVASKRMIVLRNNIAKKAKEQYDFGQCVAALDTLQQAIYFGDLPSRAHMAWILLGFRGVASNYAKAFELVKEGSYLGCFQCQGVLAYCHLNGLGCTNDAVIAHQLALGSYTEGSPYGQYALASTYNRTGYDVQSIIILLLAAVQNLADAQNSLGLMNSFGLGIAQDHTKALMWYTLAANQGHTIAILNVAHYYEVGIGVAVNKKEAKRWYLLGKAAGCTIATRQLDNLDISA